MQNNRVLQLNIPTPTKSNTVFSFFKSDLYLLLIGVIVSLSWIFNIPLFAYISFGVIIIIIAITQKSLIGVIPILLLATFVFPDENSLISATAIGSITSVFLIFVISCVIHFIKNKNKFKFPASTIGFIALFCAAFLGGITTQGHFGSPQWVLGISTTGGMFLAMLILSITITEYNPLFIAKSFVVLTLVIITQLFVYSLRQEDLLYSIVYKTTMLGWGIGNSAAEVLALAIPFVLYAMCKSRKFSILYVSVFILSMFSILTTLSRAALIAVGFLALPMVVYSLRLSVKPLLTTIFLLSLFTLAVFLIFTFFNEEFKYIINKLMTTGISDHGRIKLWKLALDVFKTHNKFFGAGYAYGSALSLDARYFVLWYHNHYLQVLANMGIFGIIAFLIHIAQRFYYTIKRHTKFTVAALWSMFIMALFGMLDITYFQPCFLIPMIITFWATQNGLKIKDPIPADETLI
ncbi:MAG: O-antigen ligase family protein [Christensenellaceae bacterium]|jgi:O-antigen ligase|nr:O-antigen ligase family protein [Christensenellaceae bacterium]